ncbi:unnamed protein product [Amoebophrya sp. A25]|nr:unnamed protein product [Amoebophrya sp. A25]|eukprot:GSA25T00010233001.1
MIIMLLSYMMSSQSRASRCFLHLSVGSISFRSIVVATSSRSASTVRGQERITRQRRVESAEATRTATHAVERAVQRLFASSSTISSTSTNDGTETDGEGRRNEAGEQKWKSTPCDDHVTSTTSLNASKSSGGYDLSHLDAEKTHNQMVGGPLQNDEALFLYSLVRGMRMKKVLEVGGLGGFSAKNFLAALPEDGTMFSVDLNKVPAQAKNHRTIQKDVALLEPADLLQVQEQAQGQPLDLLFFDCHAYEAQVAAYERLRKVNLIDDKTIIALHDTNTHPNDRFVGKGSLMGTAPAKYHEDEETTSTKDLAVDDKKKKENGFVHQWVERALTNLLSEKKGYHCFNMHPRLETQGPTEEPRCDDKGCPFRHGLTICQKPTHLRVLTSMNIRSIPEYSLSSKHGLDELKPNIIRTNAQLI